MVLLALVGRLAVVVGAMLVVATLGIVGRGRFLTAVAGWRDRLDGTWRYLLALGGVLVLNKVARDYGQELSWLLNWNVTGAIYRIEGTTVARIQSFATPELTAVLGFAYVYGYVFLLTFPFVAYFSLDDGRFLGRTAIAFGVNYVLGVLCYVLFVSYGPRNLLPDIVSPLLYVESPFAKLLTSQVNSNTNVFPSLHTSLSVTVAALAWQTRELYPRWLPLAATLAAAIVLSTVYLGIHWIVDVIGGIALGLGSVAVATRRT